MSNDPDAHDPKVLRVTLTVEMRQALKGEIRRSGVHLTEFHRLMEGVFECPSVNIISSWLHGHTKTASLSCFNEVLKHWKSLPDATRNALQGPAPLEKRMRITPYMRGELRALLQDTGVQVAPLLRNLPNMPAGLNKHKVMAWASGRTQTALPDEFHAFMKALRDLPITDEVIAPPACTQEAEQRLVLTQPMRDELSNLIAASGINIDRIMRDLKDAPAGLDAERVRGWIKGYKKSARAHEYNYIMRKLRELPKYRQDPESGAMQVCEITHPLCTRLHQLQQRSGVRPRQLLKGRKDIPEGLTVEAIYAWMSRKEKKAPVGHYNYVVKLWEEIL